MAMEEDLTLGGGHTMQFVDDVSLNCTLKTYNFINRCLPNKFILKIKQQYWEKVNFYGMNIIAQFLSIFPAYHPVSQS